MKPSNKIEAIFALIEDLRYAEMLQLASILSEAAVGMKLRRGYVPHWPRMLQSIIETKPEGST